MTDNTTTNITNNTENKKSKIRMLLESLESEIHISWLRDEERINELLELNKILTGILNCESIEDYFQNNDSDFDYFMKKFSKETINNIVRQHFIIGENGDEIGLNVLGNYLKIFIKFMNKANYFPLWESIKDIFDYNKPFYKGSGYSAVLSKIDNNRKISKIMSADNYNELFLNQNTDRFSVLNSGEEIDVFYESKKYYGTNVQSDRYWTRGIIKDIFRNYFTCHLAEEEKEILLKKTSLNYAKKNTYTKSDYEWRTTLQPGNVVECYDRSKFYPATIIDRFEEIRNNLTFVSYKIGFRLYPENFPEWEKYRNFWADSSLAPDKKNAIFIGDRESFDEILPYYSSRIQRLGTQDGKFSNEEIEDTFCVDDFVIYDFEKTDNKKKGNKVELDNNDNGIGEEIKKKDEKGNNFDEYSEVLKNYYIKMKSKLDSFGKSYVIAKSQSFSFYYALLISEFASNQSYEKMLNKLHKNNQEKPNPEVIYFIFLFIGFSSTILHKEYLKKLSNDMRENVINYLNELNEKDLRNIKKETIEIIQKVLQYYLSFSMCTAERNLIIENFSISFSLKMLKSSLLDKRISAVKNIVDIIKNAKEDKEKTEKLLDIIEEHKIFNEIFGANSHIQLINRSKNLLEIMLLEDKLSNEEMEIIWEATKKGDSEGKLTILKLLKEISSYLKEKQIKMILTNIYITDPENLIKEEIDLIYELATHNSQPKAEIEKVINYFLKGLFDGKIDDNEEKIKILIDKIIEIIKSQKNAIYNNNDDSDVINDMGFYFLENVVKKLVDIVAINNIQNSYIALRILKVFFKEYPEIYSETTNDRKPIIDLNEFINSLLKNFEEYRKLIKNTIHNKNWTKDIDLLSIDNFSYSKNIRKRLGIINTIIFKKIWVHESDPIILVFNYLIEDSLSEKDNFIFYEWIQYLLNSEKLDFDKETKIFNLFNDNICADNKKCQHLSIQAFESYLKIFLDINKKNNLLDFYILKNHEEINLFTTPEELIGFEILWKIVFQSFSSEIMNRGIQTLHLLYNNKNPKNGDNLSEILLKKCVDLIKETIEKNVGDEEKHNVITKCLYVLRLMIEESEKKGTAQIKSHSGLIKNKVINLTVKSFLQRVDDFKLKLYANTTFWELKEIISKKASIAMDFLKIKINSEVVSDNKNGKTIIELNLSDGCEVEIYMNKLSESIPKAELVLEKGKINPRLLEIFNEWFDEYSDDDGKMTRELCAKFVKDVTNTQEQIQPQDYRINFLFESYDLYKEGFIPREGFVKFYTECLQNREKYQTVWDNLHNMGIRNDLRKIDEGLGSKAVSKHSLPRYKLAHNEEFFKTLFALQDSNEKIAKEAFEFLCTISTNPKIYKVILNANTNADWNKLINSSNVYKLIYTLQIIESFLEDIEIEKEGIDSNICEEYILSEETDIELVEENIQNNNIEGDKNESNRSLVNIGNLQEKKIEWMKNFIENDGFTFLTKIFEEKLDNFTNSIRKHEISIINKICVQILLKIVKIFYNSSLNKYQINKDANKLIKFIKKSLINNDCFITNKDFEIKLKSENNEAIQLKTLKSTATFNAEFDNCKDQDIENNNLDIKKVNSHSELQLEKKLSIQSEMEINRLDKIFDGELGNKIFNSFHDSNIKEKILDLLMSFDLKNKASKKFKEDENEIKCFENEDIEILENSFELFCSLISYNNEEKKLNGNNLENNSKIENLQKSKIDGELNRTNFSELCLYILINPVESTRVKSCLSLIRLSKILSHNNNFETLSIIFNELFSFILALDKSSRLNEEDNKDSNFDNHNLSHLFEYFAFLFEIYFEYKFKFLENMDKLKQSSKITPEELLIKIAHSIEEDIKSKNAESHLHNDIFIGYLKIISKVVENNNDIKNEISEKFDLIQEIMTKILFKKNDKNDYCVPNIHQNQNIQEKPTNNTILFINPESFSDSKSSRRKNQSFRNACYKFILSMIKNNLKNFESFFSINILDDDSNKLIKKNSLNFNDNNEMNDFSDNNNFITPKNLSRQNSNNNNYNVSNINKKFASFYYNYNNNCTKSYGHVGLRNLGCICYMNSMLQQFFMVSSFRKAILQVDDKIPSDFNNPYQVDDNVFHQVQRMFTYLSLSNREEYNPEGFCFSFKDYEGNPTNTTIQQDAQEFLSRFIDKIEYSLKPTNLKYLVHSVFGGKICSQLICETCNTTKKRFEDMFFLSLSVSNLKTIYDSLDKFISIEKIDEYNCETCAKKVTISKRNVLSDLPNVLIIHLQRIFYNYETDRNEKINSKLDFPKILNLKDYTLEEIEKKNYMKKNNIKEADFEKNISNANNSNNENGEEKNDENESDKVFPFESEDVYFRHDDYYEYHLVGVNVHIGSADTGHYFSYINKLRDGEGNMMSYDPKIQDEKELWLKFNDSHISKFNIEKLEEECFGGKNDTSDHENVSSWNFRNRDSIQSAYMLVYERRLKNPIKCLVPAPLESEDNLNENLITYKEEEEKSIIKEHNFLYNYGKYNFEEKSKKIFNSIFYDNARNEYYKYLPFFSVENLVPINYYQEILEDNIRLEKQQNISDEQFVKFFDNVINLLDESIKNSTGSNNDQCVANLLSVFLDFIFNILSCPDKIYLLNTAKSKLISFLEKSPNNLNAVINYLNENHEKIFKYILNDDIDVVRVHCSIIYEVIANISNLNYDLDCLDEDNSENYKVIKADLIEKAQKLIDFILFLFPKIPAKKMANIGPLLYTIRDLCNLSFEMLKYFASKEVIFIFITFILGRDSPHYQDTLISQGENWDYCRNKNIDYDPIIFMVHSIFSKYIELQSESKLKSNEELDKNNDDNINNLNLISERDLNCIKNSKFLKLAFKFDKKVFIDFIITFNKNDELFSMKSCVELTHYLDEILTCSSVAITEFINCISPILEIEDEYQFLRFCIILGYPQLIIEEATIENTYANFGYHAMSDIYTRIIEFKNSVYFKNSICLLKKVYECYSKDTVFIEIFLAMIHAAVNNHALLKYLRAFTCEDYIGEDFITLGITKIKDYCQRNKDSTYYEQLREVGAELNQILPLVNSNESILKGFKGFLGKFLTKNVKRHIYTLIYSEENLYIYKVEYLSNIIEMKELTDFDFSNSKAYKKQNNLEIESSQIEYDTEEEVKKMEENYPESEYYCYDLDNFEYNENEFLKKMTPLLNSTSKKIILNTKEKLDNYACNVIRYFAINDTNNDARVTFKIKKNYFCSENNSINEFIPEGDIMIDIANSSHKNLLVLSKIDPNLPWSFESHDKDYQNIKLEYSISVEFEEQKISYYPNLGLRNDYNDFINHYQYQRIDIDQLNHENTRSDDYQNWDDEEKI